MYGRVLTTLATPASTPSRTGSSGIPGGRGRADSPSRWDATIERAGRVPANAGQEPINVGDADCDPLFPGRGLRTR